MAKPLVLDLHIPYCIRPENYLAHFNAVGSNAEKNAYMDALKREVLSYEGELDGYEIRAVHLSGGSASVMAPDLLGDVLRTVRTHLPVAQGAEVSYDSLPVTIGTPSLTGIASGHPNRTELMMRSDNDAELKALGCTHNAQHIRNAMLFLAKFHLNNVGLTLNYGIPGQTMQSWHNSLHAAVIMQAGHITAEPLAVTDAEGKYSFSGLPLGDAQRGGAVRDVPLCLRVPAGERLQAVCCRVLCPPRLRVPRPCHGVERG